MGSGKSHLSRFFSLLGVPVYAADDAAKRLYIEDASVRGAVLELLGPRAYGADGALDRSWIASRAFNNTELLSQLEAIIHPAVARDFKRWCDAQSAHYVLKEAAILFESGGDAGLDGVIAVAAPDALRISRIQARDGSSEEAIKARWARQLPQAEVVARATYVIQNDEHSLLIPQALSIHERIQTGAV